MRIISFVQVISLVGKGYLSYLADLWDVSVGVSTLVLLLVVFEFRDVFSLDQPGLLQIEVDFYIYLEL